MQTTVEIVQEIEHLTQSPGYIHTLIFYSLKMLRKEGKILEQNPHEILIGKEVQFLYGKLLQNTNISTEFPDKNDFIQQIEVTRTLMEDLHSAILRENINSEQIFYGEPDSYHFQYLDFTKDLYQYDAQIFEDYLGFSLDDLTSFVKQSLEVFNYKVNKTIHTKYDTYNIENILGKAETLLDAFCIEQGDYQGITKEKLNIIINLFSTNSGVNQDYQHPLDYNILEAKPIIKLPDGRLFLTDTYLLHYSCYTSPFFWIKDIPGYQDIFFKNRGKATEQITAKLLEKVVGANQVHTNVNLLENKTIKGEIDVLTIFGSYAIIIQCKSKKLTKIAKKGDIKKFSEDFQGAVQDPYNQGILCKKMLMSNHYKLVSEGKEIILNEPIKNCFILCVTTDYFPTAITSTLNYLTISEGEMYPLCLSPFTLDLITHYENNIYDLLYYLRQRAKYANKIRAENELSILGLHINNKLYFEGKHYDVIYVDNDYSSLIDAHFLVERGYMVKTEEYEVLYSQWKQSDFDSIFDSIKKIGHHQLDEVIIFLYDIQGAGGEDLIKLIQEIKSGKLKYSNECKDGSILFNLEGGIGITVILFPNSYQDKEKRLLYHSTVRKYKSKYKKRLSLGIIEGSKNPFDLICYLNYECVYDKELEEQAKLFKGRVLAGSKKEDKVGRNEKCPCGSNIKYKKCCGKIINLF